MTLGINARGGVPGVRVNARHLAFPAAVLAVLALCVPLFMASPAPLTSDESLYAAEAYSIAHGKGLTYPSGEAITHRAPLWPIVLSPALRLGGEDAAYGVARLVIAVNALIVLALAWRLGGAVAGTVAGIAAAASAYLNGLGTTLYLDPLQCTALLAALASLRAAYRGGGARWYIASGVALGLAFLVKESAIQWAPLALLGWLALPAARTRAHAIGAAAATAAFAATVAPWWAWVWLHDGQLFMLGDPGAATFALVGAAALSAALFVAACLSWPNVPSRVRAGAARTAPYFALAGIVAWGALLLAGLTAFATWPYPNDYVRTVPDYLTTVAPQAQPYFLLVAAWGWLAYRARTGEDERLLVIAAAMFAPFALFAANRGLQLRDALPLVYLSYIALGVAASGVLTRLRAAAPEASAAVAAVLVVGGVGLVAHQAAVFRSDRADASSAISWDSDFTRDSARWMTDNLPPGSHVLSSRLYFSSLYVQSGARFEVRQLPTVRVDVDPARPGLLDARSNLFRWGDADLRNTRPDERWLYLRQFPGKRYWVALSQQELLEYAARNESDFLVLTGEDAAFSSVAWRLWLDAHPAFTRVREDVRSAAEQLLVYRIDRTKLAPTESSVWIDAASFAALRSETDLSREALETALGAPMIVTGSAGGSSAD